jgi:large conductance mechanosensitive channel
MLEEFKKFALRGNVVDLAVGVIIGAAFGAIVASIVGDVVMPVIGAITGGLDFSKYYLPLSAKVQAGLSYSSFFFILLSPRITINSTKAHLRHAYLEHD